jgi:glycosyltransferase involved in cell wall biosynthesis
MRSGVFLYEHGEDMKIGMISTAFPRDMEKDVYGIFKRVGMFIDALKGLGELDILFYVPPEIVISQAYIAEMQERLEKHWGAKLRIDLCNLAPYKQPQGRWQEYFSPALRMTDHPPYRQTAQREQVDAVRPLLERKPDIVFVQGLAAITPFLLAGAKHPRVFFDLNDIEHVAFSRLIKQPPYWTGKFLQYLRLPILKYWERRAIRASHMTFVCSDIDRQYLSTTFGCRNIKVVSNAIEIHEIEQLADAANLLFIGRLSYQPNTVAAEYLITKIWPIVHVAMPGARLLIAGSKPEKIPSFSSNPAGVDFLGFIDDLEKLYRDTAVVCCPILSGGGTRIKILEAASFGKPVVSTTIGAEGIDFRDGDEILLRDDPESFAETCLLLLADKRRAAEVGKSAHLSVAQKYDRTNVIKSIGELLAG